MIGRIGRAIYDNAYFLLAATSLFWAGNQIVGRMVAGHVPPVTLGFSRWLLASLIITPLAWPHLTRDWSIVRANLPLLAFLGVIGGGTLNTLQYIGLNYTTALNALVLNSAAPVLIAVACTLIFRDRLTRLQSLGIAISLAGVLAIIARGDPAGLLALSFNRGDAIIFVGMVSWAVYTAFLRKRPALHPFAFVAVMFWAAALVNLPFAALELAGGQRLHPDLKTTAAILYVGLFAGVLAYLAYVRGVELIGGPRAGAFTHMIPFFGAILAMLFLNEALASYHLYGLALILFGVWLAARPK
ncbi:MAG TPA: DMT family transporter [Hyphomicrobiaceae bacterium]|nr:DMT family transporter [Hyphomicrobiaceae bacterium]